MVYFEQAEFNLKSYLGPNKVHQALKYLKNNQSGLRSSDDPVDSDPRKDSYLYFKAMILTPTTSKQYVRNIMNSKAKVRTLDKVHDLDSDKNQNAMFMNCDKAEYVNANKIYIICWR